MTDRLSVERRSWLMSRIPSANTSPEIRVRSIAHALGLRFRLHRKDLPGTPDLVFSSRRAVLFVSGCFWHRHSGCRKASMPKTRKRFWAEKFARNVARDRRVQSELRKLGWKTVVVWECQTKRDDVLRNILTKRIASLTRVSAGH